MKSFAHNICPNVVLFDAGGTLIRLKKSFAAFIKETYHVEEMKQIDHLIEKCFQSSPACLVPERIWISDHLIDSELYKVYLNALRQVTPYYRRWAEGIVDIVKNSESWELLEEAKDLLESLRRAGCRLGIVSNWGSHLNRILDDLSVAQYFDVIVSSAAVGYAKPDHRIFIEGVRYFQSAPFDSLYNVAMVGDSYRQDIRPAQKLGMIPFFLTNCSSSFLLEGNHIMINGLNEILNYIPLLGE